MQVRMITVNAAGMAGERSTQGKTQQVQSVDDMFGAQCKVTISQEGRRLSRQQTEQTEPTEQSVRNARAERILFLQQEAREQYKNIRSSYREELERIEKEIGDLNDSYIPQEDKVTVEKQQEVLRAMRSQKQAQMEENERLAKEAQQMTMQFSKYQEQIDENNRDLLTMLKSMEEAQKAEKDQENGQTKNDNSVENVIDNGIGGNVSGIKNSAGDLNQNSVAQFMESSVRREWSVEELLAGRSDEGYQLIDLADTITQNVTRQGEKIMAALDDEFVSDDELAEMMENYQNGMTSNYKEVESARQMGMQILRDVRESKISHIADNPLGGMSEAVKTMTQSAIDAAYNEAVQGSLKEASQELEDEVEKLIDQRNDADKIRQDDEEDFQDGGRRRDSGAGRTVVDGVEREVRAGDVTVMKAGRRHTVFAETELKLMEVQLGEDITVRDKQKFYME